MKPGRIDLQVLKKPCVLSHSGRIFWRATQVKKALSMSPLSWKVKGVLNMRERDLNRPKKHSMSLRTDSICFRHSA